MTRLIIKIGGNMKEDLRKVFENPKKYAQPGTHTVYLKNAVDLATLLSPKKFQLLKEIIETQTKKKTLGEIAAKLKRKQEAVSRDATLLERHGIIKKAKEKQKVFLKSNYDSLQIQLVQ